jgi:hypothetical protein
LPRAGGIQRHEFDEAKAQSRSRANSAAFEFVVVDFPDDHGVDFDQ